jgi:cyclophilin family peptidyl-prolyl cis-trans isomerase
VSQTNIFDTLKTSIQTLKNNTMKKIALVFSLALAFSAGALAQGKSNPIVLISTSMGDIKVMLYNETPLHRDNFLELAKSGKFDGSVFHRVINRFMIQGGGSASVGTIDNRPEIPAEINAKFIHKKGALAAARTGDHVNPERKSSGSQFYIVQGQTYPVDRVTQMQERSGVTYTEEQKKVYAELGGTPHLDMQYTVFGEVIEGLDIVDKIAAVKTHQADVPVEAIPMKVTIIRK